MYLTLTMRRYILLTALLLSQFFAANTLQAQGDFELTGTWSTTIDGERAVLYFTRLNELISLTMVHQYRDGERASISTTDIELQGPDAVKAIFKDVETIHLSAVQQSNGLLTVTLTVEGESSTYNFARE